MAKHKTAELEGALLDAAVAKAEGWVRWVNGVADPVTHLHFSTDWAEGGPIIARELIGLVPETADWWHATPHYANITRSGPTPLIAAMRAFVASKLGEEVELP